MSVKSLLPNFGSNRLLAQKYAESLDGCPWVGVIFSGGMSEVKYLTARTIVINDIHRAAINLARVVADPYLGSLFYRALRRVPFHPDRLIEAQEFCLLKDKNSPTPTEIPQLAWAIEYFVCAWMSRNGTCLTKSEFTSGFSIRWNADGGDSVVRFRSATEAALEFQQVFQRCTFQCLDWPFFLEKCKDTPDTGLLVDAPWPDDGGKYRHSFTTEDQELLAAALSELQHARIVVRYGEHPLIRKLYPENLWTWNELTSRTQSNKGKAEVLLLRKR